MLAFMLKYELMKYIQNIVNVIGNSVYVSNKMDMSAGKSHTCQNNLNEDIYIYVREKAKEQSRDSGYIGRTKCRTKTNKTPKHNTVS